MEPLRYIIGNSLGCAAMLVGGPWMVIDWAISGGSMAQPILGVILIVLGVYCSYVVYKQWVDYLDARRHG